MNDNKIINCLKCYRVHHCGDDVYFCPFFGINPCIRGEHAVIIKKSVKVKPIKQEIKIPDVVPFLRNTPIKSAFDWETHHKELFTRLYSGEDVESIAKSFGIPKGTLEYYLKRYR